MTPSPRRHPPASAMTRALVLTGWAALATACSTGPTPTAPTRPAEAAPSTAPATSPADESRALAAVPADSAPFFFCTGRVATRIATPEAYAMAIQQKICANIRLPRGVTGDPAVVFAVVQQPSGRVASVRLRQSSGNRALDKAIASAIRKSSPLPRPDKPELFNPTLELKFYPLRG